MKSGTENARWRTGEETNGRPEDWRSTAVTVLQESDRAPALRSGASKPRNQRGWIGKPFIELPLVAPSIACDVATTCQDRRRQVMPAILMAQRARPVGPLRAVYALQGRQLACRASAPPARLGAAAGRSPCSAPRRAHPAGVRRPVNEGPNPEQT